MKDKDKKDGQKAPVEKSRREFLSEAASGTLTAAAIAGAGALLTNSDEAQAKATWGEWFQKNYRLMTDEEKKESKDEEKKEPAEKK